MIKGLPPFDKVFFVHYLCDNFNEGEQITALCIYSNGNAKIFSGAEAENIKEYVTKVNELLDNGLTLVHWNQNRPNFGIDHIKKRYKDLTGWDLELDYQNEINLAEWLVFKYGETYISHPRLDNLAKLNAFSGISEISFGKRTYTADRLNLLTKIYFNALNDTLKTEREIKENGLMQKALNEEINLVRYNAKHYSLAYYFECHANGIPTKIGSKKLLEQEGNKRIGAGKGNRFYKAFNEISQKDLNSEKILIQIGGDNWREAVINLSKTPDLVDKYLKVKML